MRATLATLLCLAGLALAVPASAQARSCGRVTFGDSATPITFKKYLRVQRVTCRRAIRIVELTVFGQGAPPPGPWYCDIGPSSIRGHCYYSDRRLSYGRRGHVPPL